MPVNALARPQRWEFEVPSVNALFQPLQAGLDRYQRNQQQAVENRRADEQLGFQRQRLGMERERFDEEKEQRALQALGRVGQVIDEETDPLRRAGMIQKLYQSNPNFQSTLKKYGIDPDDHAVVPRFLRSQAPSYDAERQQERGFRHAEKMQGGQFGQQRSMAELQHALEIRMLKAKSAAEIEQLKQRAQALGLELPTASGGPPADHVVDGYRNNDPALPAAPGQPDARPVTPPSPAPYYGPPPAPAPVDPYRRMLQPAIPRTQEEAERRRRAGTAMVMGDPKQAGKILNKEDDLKEHQTKDALWGERMARSEVALRGILQNYSGLVGQGGPESRANRAWFDDSILNSSSWRQYQGAAREWIAALLRKDTGAAVTETEWKLYFPTYFPQPGDNPAEIQQKMERRMASARGLRAASGPAFDRMYPGFEQEMGTQLDVQDRAKKGGPALSPGAYVYDPSTGTLRPK